MRRFWRCLRRRSAEPTSRLAEQQVRRALTDWLHAFNAGDTGSVCNLFAPDLRYDYRGFPERGFAEICGLLQRLAGGQEPEIHLRPRHQGGHRLRRHGCGAAGLDADRQASGPGRRHRASDEPGLDIFRRQTDGSWKIVRYMAFEE